MSKKPNHKERHVHDYQKGRSKLVVVCSCGSWKFTEWAKNNLPTFTEVKTEVVKP